MFIAILAEVIILLIIIITNKRKNKLLWALFIIVGIINIVDAILN